MLCFPEMLWGGPDQGPNHCQQYCSPAPAQNHSPWPELPSLTFLPIPVHKGRGYPMGRGGSRPWGWV